MIVAFVNLFTKTVMCIQTTFLFSYFLFQFYQLGKDTAICCTCRKVIFKLIVKRRVSTLYKLRYCYVIEFGVQIISFLILFLICLKEISRILIAFRNIRINKEIIFNISLMQHVCINVRLQT